MITIIVYQDKDGFVSQFIASGHAGYDDYGKDIVCAAITALATTTIGSLQALADIDPERRLEDGRIEISLPDQKRLTEEQKQIASILMQSLMIGCCQIEASYGDRYVKVHLRANKGEDKNDSCQFTIIGS